jgi:hypothetical protein
MTVVDVEQLVDPELEGLLRELGSRPRSVFLRRSRKEAMRVLRSRTTEPISSMAVSDALERELLTVHRAELAEILKQACRTKLLEGEREKLFIMHYRTATERVDALPLKTISARHGRAQDAGVAEPWIGGVPVLGGLLSPQGLHGASVLDLSALGQRIQPRDTWRVISAMSLLATGGEHAASDISRTVLNGWPETEDALRALEILAMSEATAGNPSTARELQEAACALKENYPLGKINVFLYAVLAGNEAAAICAARDLEGALQEGDPLVDELSHASGARWKLNSGAPTPAAARLASKLQPRIGSVARRLTRVFLER